MMARIFPILTVATLLTLTTGCSGMQSFLFGRGARCGLCNRLSTAGQALNPFAPAPGSQPTCNQSPYAQPGYGQAPRGVSPQAPAYGVPHPGAYATAPGCNSCVGSGTHGGDCGCGNVVHGYRGVIDPYSDVYYGDDGIPTDGFYPRDSNGLPILGEDVPAPDQG